MSKKNRKRIEQKAKEPVSPRFYSLLHAHKQFLVLSILVFAVTRLYLLLIFQPQYSDISVYAQFAYEYLAASRQGVSFYQFHAKVIEAQQKEAVRSGWAAAPDEQKIIPYPPLAIQLLRVPSLFIRTDLAWTQQSFHGFAVAYQSVFRRMLFLFDSANLLLIMIVLIRRKNTLSMQKKMLITLSYILGILTLPHILYDRLDLVVGTLLLLSTIALTTMKNYLWSFVALAFAVNFKISPIVVVPIFVIASIAATASRENSYQTIRGIPWKLLLIRTTIITGFIFLLFFPFFILFGKESLSAFVFQYNRGLHIESFYSAILLLFSIFSRIQCSVGHSYSAFILQSPFSQTFSALSNVFTSVAIIGIFIVFYRWYVVKKQFLSKTASKDGMNNQEMALNQFLVNGQLLCIIALIVFSKNFSPQYLFWLFPMLFVMNFHIRCTLQAAIIYLFVCVVSTVIFPYFYFSDIVAHLTFFGKTALIVRAFAIASFMMCILVSFRQDAHLPQP